MQFIQSQINWEEVALCRPHSQKVLHAPHVAGHLFSAKERRRRSKQTWIQVANHEMQETRGTFSEKLCRWWKSRELKESCSCSECQKIKVAFDFGFTCPLKIMFVAFYGGEINFFRSSWSLETSGWNPRVLYNSNLKQLKVSPIKNYCITCLLFVININANIQEKLKPGASSPGAKQFGDQPTNQWINRPINGRTKSLIEVLARD